MADLIIPSGYGNAVLQLQLSGRANPYTTSLGYAYGDAVTAQEAADAIFDAFSSGTAPYTADHMYNGWQFVGVHVTQQVGIVTYVADSSQDPITGTAGSSAQPVMNSAFIVRKRTGIGGRRFRGRFYAPLTNLLETQVDPYGFIDDTIRNNYQLQWTAAYDNLEPAVTGPVLLHSHADDEPTPITSFTLQSYVGTQRRRIR